ncbi:MAG: hypothetical protein JNM70_18265 [Anaerolineae bacterium]|nr:hypothetical protein [Anaerolineae bacterium]
MSENIFGDDWRECLQAHYVHVVRSRDHVTRPTLRVVMQQAGFDESQMAEMEVRATMHVDDAGADFVPDAEMVRSFAVATPSVEPAEAMIDDEPELETPPGMDEAAFIEEESPANNDDDAPQQLSLF